MPLYSVEKLLYSFLFRCVIVDRNEDKREGNTKNPTWSVNPPLKHQQAGKLTNKYVFFVTQYYETDVITMEMLC